MPSPLQAQFCRAQYVIHARVVDFRTIYEDPPVPVEPEVITVPDIDTITTTHSISDVDSEEIEPPVTHTQTEDDSQDDSQEEEGIDPEFQPEGPIPEEGPGAGREEKKDEEDFNNEISNVVTGLEGPLARVKKSAGLPPPPLPDLDDVDLPEERMPIGLAWQVEIRKIYKGRELFTQDSDSDSDDSKDEGEEKKIVVELFTAPQSSLCGVTSLQLDGHYAMGGRYYGDKLRISSCDIIKDYKSLTSRQKQGLKGGYQRGCEECRIKPCFAFPCNETEDECPWYPFNDVDCEDDYSRCLRKKKGNCGWHNNKHMHGCLNKE